VAEVLAGRLGEAEEVLVRAAAFVGLPLVGTSGAM
jgi:hypothetical protein